MRKLQSIKWGKVDGDDVYLFTLFNNHQSTVTITNYGATVTSIITPDKHGNRTNVVLGFDSLHEYLNPLVPYFGSTIGRCANRIAKGKFFLNGKEFTLATNNGPNHLHGGLKGFDKRVWIVKEMCKDQLILQLNSPDGEEGYPGNLNVRVTFSFSDDNELRIQYDAETDMETPVNLTNHSYFNLTGNVENTILQHRLMINADKYTPVDETLIPTGELKDVASTPFDFTQPKIIEKEILLTGGGFDHNFVLNNQNSGLELAAVLYDEISGRRLETYTTEPGIQFYSGNFLDSSLFTRDGKTIKKHAGLCLETQHFPDSPNQPLFPSVILQPDQHFHSETVYKLLIPPIE